MLKNKEIRTKSKCGRNYLHQVKWSFNQYDKCTSSHKRASTL